MSEFNFLNSYEATKIIISYQTSCGRLCFPRNWSTTPKAKVMSIKLFLVSPYYPFDIYKVFSDIPFGSIPDTGNLCLFSTSLSIFEVY